MPQVWCQPWTILSTGSAAVLIVNTVLHNTIATSIITLVILAWWYLFLVLVPSSYREAAEEQNRQIR